MATKNPVLNIFKSFTGGCLKNVSLQICKSYSFNESRYSGLSKNIVSAGISEKCLIQLAYAIGVSKPLSIFIKLSNGDEDKVSTVKKIIDKNFDLSPRGIREMLKLNNPIYEVTSAYGHFGRKPSNTGEFTWEKTDKSDLFKL